MKCPILYLWLHHNLKQHKDINSMVDIGKVREVFSTHHIRKEMINEVIKEMVVYKLLSKKNRGKNSDKVFICNISDDALKKSLE